MQGNFHISNVRDASYVYDLGIAVFPPLVESPSPVHMVTVMKMMAIGMEVVMMENIEIVISTGMRIMGEIWTMEGKRIVTGTILMRMTDTVPGKQMIGKVTNTGVMRKILTEHTMMTIITLPGFLLFT
jgi:hypothetical protein